MNKQKTRDNTKDSNFYRYIARYLIIMKKEKFCIIIRIACDTNASLHMRSKYELSQI